MAELHFPTAAAAAKPPSPFSHLETIGPDVDYLTHLSHLSLDTRTRSPPSSRPRSTSRTPSLESSLLLSPAPYSPPRYYAATLAEQDESKEPVARARSISLSRTLTSPPAIFESHRATRPSILKIRTLDTSPCLRHVAELDGVPVLELRQRGLHRKHVRLVSPASGAHLATLKRTRTAGAHGHANLTSPRSGAALASLDWSRALDARDLDLALAVQPPLSSPLTPTATLGPQTLVTTHADAAPPAPPTLDLRVRSAGDGYATLACAGASLARFNRRPRLLGSCDAAVEPGVDVALVAVAALAGMYALEDWGSPVDREGDGEATAREKDTVKVPRVRAPELFFQVDGQGGVSAPAPGVDSIAQGVDSRGMGVGLGLSVPPTPNRQRRSLSALADVSPTVRTADVNVGSGNDGKKGQAGLRVAGRRSVSGARGRWEGAELI